MNRRRPTVARYLQTLEEIFLVKRIPGWSRNLGTRATAAAKLIFVDSGIAANELAATGERRTTPTTPFFRFPGFASTPALLDRPQARGIVVFGADVWASDWLTMTPEQELQLILSRIAKLDHGIVLLHDTKAQTARMLPAFLRELKKRGYRIIHVVAGPGNSS